MLKNRTTIIASIISIVIILLISIGLGYFYISSSLSSKDLEKIVKEKIKLVLPDGKLELTNFKVKYGFDINFSIGKIKSTINYKNEEVDLFKANDIYGSVSLFSILTTRPIAKITIKNPVITYIDVANKNNWSIALRKGSVTSIIESKSKKTFGLIIPGLINRSIINLDLSNVAISYKLSRGWSGSILLSKCSLKNLNFHSSSAFKVESNFKIDFNNENRLMFDTLVIGQFNLSELFNKGVLKSLVMFRPKNIMWNNHKIDFNDSKVTVNFMLKKSGEINGDYKMNVGDKDILSFIYNVNSDNTRLSNIDLKVGLPDIYKMLEMDSSTLGIDKNIFKLKGQIEFSDGLVKPIINFNVTPVIKWNYRFFKGDMNLEGIYSGNKVEIKAMNKLLGGNFDTIIKGTLDINSESKYLIVKPLDIKIGLAHLKTSKVDLQKFIYFKEKKSQLAILKKIGPLPASILIEGKQLQIDEENFEVNSNVLLTRNNFAVKNLSFKMGSGSGFFTSLSEFKEDKIINNFSVTTQNVPLEMFESFLPPVYGILDGRLSGPVDGKFVSNNESANELDINFKLKIEDGKIEGIKIDSKFDKFLSKTPFLKDKHNRKIHIDEKFSKLSLNGKILSKNIDFDKINLIGMEQLYTFSGKGILNKNKGPSQFDFIFKDNSGILGDILIPVRFEGPGYDIGLNQDYTNIELKEIMKKRYRSSFSKKNKKRKKQKKRVK